MIENKNQLPSQEILICCQQITFQRYHKKITILKSTIYHKLKYYLNTFVAWELLVTCFPRYRRPSPRGKRRMRGSLNSESRRSINANIIPWAASSLQEPTYTKPNEIAVNAITSRGALLSLRIRFNLLRIWQIM